MTTEDSHTYDGRSTWSCYHCRAFSLFSFPKWNVIFFTHFFSPWNIRWAEDDWKELSLTARQAERVEKIRNVHTHCFLTLNLAWLNYTRELQAYPEGHYDLLIYCPKMPFTVVCEDQKLDLRARMATPYRFSVTQCEIMHFCQQAHILIVF